MAKENVNEHPGFVLWFTGLPCSGKSTLASCAEGWLHSCGYRAVVLDGDNIRHGLCKDLGFSEEDRRENIRRVAEAAKLFAEAGIIVLTALISPFRVDRESARTLFPADNFLEIYCNCPLAVCEARDVKGHYRQARSGALANFTGISSPYENPLNPDLELDTSALTPEQCVERLRALLPLRFPYFFQPPGKTAASIA